MTCALYLSSDRSLVACSEEVIVPASSNGWFEATPLSPYTVNSGTRYIICVWAQGTSSDEIIHYFNGSAPDGDTVQVDLSRTYAAESCPTPNQNDFRYNGRRASLYIVYGESATSRVRRFSLIEENQ
ncbi:MAG: hypothetical protein AB1752_13505 [Candidatus Zixiibacteriota bacterium]